MELLVDDAARRRHPLHVARSNHAPVAAAPIIVIIMILVILVAIISLSLSLSFYHLRARSHSSEIQYELGDLAHGKESTLVGRGMEVGTDELIEDGCNIFA